MDVSERLSEGPSAALRLSIGNTDVRSSEIGSCGTPPFEAYNNELQLCKVFAGIFVGGRRNELHELETSSGAITLKSTSGYFPNHRLEVDVKAITQQYRKSL